MDTNNTQFGHSYAEVQGQQIKITDLIKELFEQIFMYLDFASVVRAADVCKLFREASKRPFKKKYAKNVVELAITPKSSELYHVKDGHVVITDLKIGMSTLRCFGDSITQLHVMNPNLKNYDDAYDNYLMRFCFGELNPGEMPPDNTFRLYWERKIRNVLLYANKFCHESLIKFSIDPPIGINKLRRSFSNVQHVCIANYLHQPIYKCGSLNAIFPQLRCLTIGTNCNNTEYIPELELLPNLQEITYVFYRCGFRNRTLAVALRSNPQLRKFTVKIHDRLDFESLVTECVPHLQSIQEFDLIYKDVNLYRGVHKAFYNEGNKIHLSNVRIFKLDLDTTCEGTPLPQIQFEFNQLKSFSLEGDFLHDDSFFDFIRRHPTITSLFLKNKFIRHFLDKPALMSALPLLEELVILPSDEVSLSISFLIDYLTDFDSVNRCMFYCRDAKDDVIKCCGFNWNAQIIPHNHLLTLITLTRIH